LDSDAKYKEETSEQTSEEVKQIHSGITFDQIWESYPKREGSNSKSGALKHFKARLAEGCKIEEMAAGVARYLLFCQLKGWIKTGYVMQATRFFGTSKEFENDWEIANANQNSLGSQHGFQYTGSPSKLSTVGKNGRAAEQYLAELERESQSTSGDDGALVAETR
jgi:hypothetical protein